jgi:hypothetical protein
MADAWRLRQSAAYVPRERARQIGDAGVVFGVVAGILLAGAPNPFLCAAFGLVSILVIVAWLEEPQPSSGERSRA